MPTYEYLCRACGHTFEIVQRMTEDSLTTCPECGGELRKVFAPPAISFKGSGFYATDHGKKTKTPPGDGSSEKKPSDVKPSEKKPAETSSTGNGGSTATPPKKEGSSG
jgi:putative FmdB family regulatory protein